MSRPKADVSLKWGHRVFDPEGNEVRLPAKELVTLRRCGALRYNVFLKGHQITEFIHTLLTPEYDAITDGLRRVLGTSLQGPRHLVCRCRRCRLDRSERAKDMQEGLSDFKRDLQLQQNAE